MKQPLRWMGWWFLLALLIGLGWWGWRVGGLALLTPGMVLCG